MKRTIIAVATVVLATVSSLALAQDQFMDDYWKRPEATTYNVQPSTDHGASRADFDFVDRTPAQ
jgi:hypothetical protein